MSIKISSDVSKKRNPLLVSFTTCLKCFEAEVRAFFLKLRLHQHLYLQLRPRHVLKLRVVRIIILFHPFIRINFSLINNNFVV